MAAITRWVLAHKRMVDVVLGRADGGGHRDRSNSATKAMDQKFSVPGKEGWETNVAITEHFHGTGGDTAPIVPGGHAAARARRSTRPACARQLDAVDRRLEQALPGRADRVLRLHGRPRASSRSDGRTTFALVYPRPDPNSAFGENPDAAKDAPRRARGTTVAGAPVHVSGFDALQNAAGGDNGTGRAARGACSAASAR